MNQQDMEVVKEDFRVFLYLVWMHLGLPCPTPIQYDVAAYLQHGPKRLIVEAFRGVGKSWITAAFVCWLLLCDPQAKILVVSASKERADAFSIFVKRLISEMEILEHLRPGPNCRDSNIAFDVGPALNAQAPSVKSVGITGQLAGSRATHIVADDVEIPKNSMTQLQRDKLAEAVKEFDAVLSPGGRITYLGTPQTEMSLYNKLEERGYAIRIWPVRYPNKKYMLDEKYVNRLAPLIMEQLEQFPELEWTSTEPTRFSELDLREREASYGRSGFAMQFMLDTSLSDEDRYPLRLKDLIVLAAGGKLYPQNIDWCNAPDKVVNDLANVGMTGDRWYRPMFTSEHWSPFEGGVMAIDPSGRGTDETSYAIVKMGLGMLYLTASGGVSGGYTPEALNKLAQVAKEHQVATVIVESNFGDGMFTALLKPVMQKVWPTLIEEVRHSKQKELRIIDTLEPVINQHRLVVLQSVIEQDAKTPDRNYQLFYQLTRVTRERGALAHDDRLDALAIAVAYWVERMSVDCNDMASAQMEEMLTAAADSFIDYLRMGPLSGGNSPSSRTLATSLRRTCVTSS